MASMSSPTSLATFTYAHASSSRTPHVTLAPVHGSRSRLAVAAVHGDGVWTYDVKTLRPTTTFTVPPSTVFASPPTSIIVDDERVTVVGIHSGENVREESSALWVWRGEEGDKYVVELEQPVHAVHPVGTWPMVVVSTTSHLALLSSDLVLTTITSPVSSKAKTSRVIASSIIDSSRIVLVDERGRVSILSIDIEAARADLVTESSLCGKDSLLAADVGVDGLITAIDNAHRVLTLHVRDLGTSGPPAGVSLIHPSTPATIIALPSASRDLAAVGIPYPTPSVVLTAPSADLPAVLSSTELSTSSSAVVSHLALIAQTSSTQCLLGSVVTHPGPDGSGRSVIYTVDVTLPTGGVGLALLVGSSERTANIFNSSEAVLSSSSTIDRLIEQVRSALRLSTGDAVERAERIFASWLEDEDRNAPTIVSGIARRAILPEPVVRRVIEVVFTAALSKPELEQSAEKTGPYPEKIIRALIDRRAAVDTMWPGGLVLGALVPCSDTRNISRFIRTNPSLPSRTIVTLIRLALEPNNALRLSSVIDDILYSPVPDPAYRAELYRQLDAPGAARVLELLVQWAEVHVDRGDGLDVWPERQPHGNSVPPLRAIIVHTSFILDAHLPSLLSLAEAEPLLERLQVALGPLLAAQNDYRRLRAPIDAALALIQRADIEEEAVVAMASIRRRMNRPEGKTPGLTSETVDKWRVEDFVF